MTMVKCPECGREWDDESEQAACIRLYGQCVVCVVQKVKDGHTAIIFDLDSVMLERKRYISCR